MKFTFLNAHHAFLATPGELDVDLAITSIETEFPTERARITVTISDPDFKKLTLEQIETLAIARARVLLAT